MSAASLRNPERSAHPLGHVSQLDGLRGVAILMVFVCHAFKANLLWMGVDLFFVLSGFLITGILLSQKEKPFGTYLGAFYRRRVQRILPAYAVVLAISVALFGGAWLRYWYLYLGGMNFLAPLGLPHLQVHPFWSLAVEEQFYLVWPLAVYFLSRKQLTMVAVSILVLAPILRYVCTPYFASTYAIGMLSPFRADTIAAGALMAIHWPTLQSSIESNAETRKRVVRAFAVLMFFGLACALTLNSLGYLVSNGNRIGNTFLYEATLAITGSMFALALFGVARKPLSSWPMAKLGRISYSFYLFHLTAIAIVPKQNGVIAFFVTLAYATAMWVFVEGPILNIGKSPALRAGRASATSVPAANEAAS